MTISEAEAEKIVRTKSGSKGLSWLGPKEAPFELKEVVDCGFIVGRVFTEDGKDLGWTTMVKIHHSHTGAHIVPYCPMPSKR